MSRHPGLGIIPLMNAQVAEFSAAMRRFLADNSEARLEMAPSLERLASLALRSIVVPNPAAQRQQFLDELKDAVSGWGMTRTALISELVESRNLPANLDSRMLNRIQQRSICELFLVALVAREDWPLVAGWLESPDSQDRALAYELMNRMGSDSEAVVESYLRSLESGRGLSLRVNDRLIEAAKSIPLIRQRISALYHRNGGAGELEVLVAVDSGDDALWREVKRYCKSGREHQRCAAVGVIGRLTCAHDDPDAENILDAALEDPESCVRAQAAVSLSKWHPTPGRFLLRLIAHLDDDSGYDDLIVCECAGQALAAYRAVLSREEFDRHCSDRAAIAHAFIDNQ